MAILVIVRHGRSTANAEGLLAGWTPGVSLDDKGREQAARVGRRLEPTPLAAVVSSPLDRCRQTAAAVVAGQPGKVAEHTDEQLGECRYGAWTGRPLKDLAREPLWRDVQEHPSTVAFPAHDDYQAESIEQMQRRAVRAVREWDSRVEEEHGPGAVWVAVSHGDVIKSLVADALASPLDAFQRIVIDPASITIVRYGRDRPFVLRVNDTGSDPLDLTALSATLARKADSAGGAADGDDADGRTPGGHAGDNAHGRTPGEHAGDDAAIGGGAGTD